MQEKFKKLLAFFKDWKNQSRYFKWMMSETKPFMKSLILILFLNLLVSLAGIGDTVVTKYIIDSAVSTDSGFTTVGVVLLIILTAASIAVSSVSGLISNFINEKFGFSIRTKVFDKVLRSRWQKIVSYHSGDILTRLTSDVDSVASGIASIIPGIIYLIVRLLIAFCVLFYYDHFLALAALALGPVGVLLSLVFSGKLKKCQEELKKIESEYRSFMQESVENVTVIKTFGREGTFIDKLSELRDRRLRAVKKRNLLNTEMSVCIQAVFSLGYLVAFAWSIYCLNTKTITYGTMTLFLSLVSQVQGPIMGLGNIIPQFINVLASTGRIMEIDSLDKEPLPGKSKLTYNDYIGIRFEDVTFAYDSETVLDRIGFDIHPNDVVGIVGSSGIGKTTLARIILSLIEPKADSQITFYNEDGAEEKNGINVRSLISYVPQGNTLISGTIADNLRLGKETATESEMWQALEIADARDFIRALPDGLDSLIGEKTVGLSEGQAQRIGIARAIIKASPILIFDESTSALDAKTEENIIRKLNDSSLIRTCIIITHRESMLKFCNKALKISDKKVQQVSLTPALPSR